LWEGNGMGSEMWSKEKAANECYLLGPLNCYRTCLSSEQRPHVAGADEPDGGYTACKHTATLGTW